MPRIPLIDTAQDARNLAGRLTNLGPEDKPVLVIASNHTGSFLIDVDLVAKEVGKHADVVTIRTGEPTRALTEALPPKTQVFGSAGRLYGTDRTWMSNPYSSRLRMAATRAEAEKATRGLIADVIDRGAATRPSTPAPAVVTTGVAAPDGVDVTAVLRQNEALARENTAVREENLSLRGRLTNALARATGTRKKVVTVTTNAVIEADLAAFADPVEQFRHEVYLEWTRRIPAAQKVDLPLAAYTLGPDFLDALASTGGISREKVVAVTVEVLTGMDKDLASRALHALTVGPTGPPLVRHDGATCWRVYLETKTASARRLHYWRLPGGDVELSRVGLHDDFTP